MLIGELDICFPTNHVLDFLGIVFPQYWLQENVDNNFGAHLAILKGAFCQPQPMVDVKGDDIWVSSVLSASALDEHMAMFKMAIKSNSKPILHPPFTMNSMTKLW